jgi:hypothetical protein
MPILPEMNLRVCTVGRSPVSSSIRGVALLSLFAACAPAVSGVKTDPAVKAQRIPTGEFDDKIDDHSKNMREQGREIFRYDTFGSEAFWGGKMGLHRAVAGQEHGGVGKGLTPREALQAGLKVDVGKLPSILVEAIKAAKVDLDKTGTTIALLKADAVVGVKGFFNGDTMTGIGITCAFCHSTVDDSLTAGIGRRLDGWPNRDLNVGAIAAMSPTLAPMAELLKVPEDKVRAVLASWGPGRYDAELNQDGKAFRPDGKTGATLIPAAFGLAGVNLHTYTGWGSVTYWNAYVANTQMYGQGTFFDPRLKNQTKFPVAARAKFDDVRHGPDVVTAKLAPLHYYQLSIPAPKPPENSFDRAAADRGQALFNSTAQCARCHVPPLFTEPGWALHDASEIGIDDFQAKRSPDGKYRTTPLAGLFARAKGGYYHDGRFADLDAVVAHYDRVLKLGLNDANRRDLVQYLKSL